MNIAELARIHNVSFSYAPRPWSEAELDSILNLTNVRLFQEDGGFAIFRFVGPEAELLTIAVDPRCRRQGTANKILLNGHEAAKKFGVEEVFLEVSEENLAAKALYEQFGYEFRALRKNYYFGPNGQKVNGLVMRCIL